MAPSSLQLPIPLCVYKNKLGQSSDLSKEEETLHLLASAQDS
jgi:hypothetical protein